MNNSTREKLIKAGAKAMLAKSYNAVGIQEILNEVNVPKGSFYHYFDAKEDFGISIIEYYGQKLANSINTKLSDSTLSPRSRILDYFLGIREYYFQYGCGQGCLIAKLTTEIADLRPRMRFALKAEFDNWCYLFALCIKEAQLTGEIDPEHNPESLAEFIVTSWEGALVRMQVNHNISSLDTFLHYLSKYLIPPK